MLTMSKSFCFDSQRVLYTAAEATYTDLSACGMVNLWYGMVWYGMVWYGMVCMVWYGMYGIYGMVYVVCVW